VAEECLASLPEPAQQPRYSSLVAVEVLLLALIPMDLLAAAEPTALVNNPPMLRFPEDPEH
jgi:hypothetical protein